MNNKTFKSLLAASAASLAIVGAADAGGFARGEADTSIIYEQGNFNLRSGVTYVSPTRKLKDDGNPLNNNLVGTNYAGDYIVPSFAVKANVTENLRCAATMVENNGGTAEYKVPTISGKLSEDFDTTEFGATCGVKFQLGKGNLWVLGGGFFEQFDYGRAQNLSGVIGVPLPQTVLNLQGSDVGFRAGIAYEIPEIALRGELMYRSGTSYGADGSLTNVPVPTGLAPPAPPLVVVPSVATLGEGQLPQSVKLSLQSGIAPGWLGFGSVKWTDWSVTETLDVINAANGAIISQDLFYWKDGWTVTGGVGHAFNDKISGLVALTWDRGVGTGWDLSSDTWTLSAGASFKDQWGGELRLGAGYTYITSAAETKYAPGLNKSVDSGYALAGNIGYAIKW